MPFLIIAVVAFAIMAYFSFFGGKTDVSGQADSRIRNVRAEATEIGAAVKRMYITEDGKKRKHDLMHMAVFECDDGEYREFPVNSDIFGEIRPGERATLIYSEHIFLGFGEHGAAAIADGDAVTLPDGDDFSYDDFDASIDIEQGFDLPAEAPLSAEDALYFEGFRRKVKLPAKTETIEVETDSLTGYPARDLLQKITLYPFLKRESDIVRMFERTYRDAVSDMLGFDGNSRKGIAADSVFINKNEIRTIITVQENPPPLRSKITAEFGVNE